MREECQAAISHGTVEVRLHKSIYMHVLAGGWMHVCRHTGWY